MLEQFPMTVPYRRSLSGVTRAESLVVVLILTSLVTSGFALVAKMRDHADNALALANMRQIGCAIASYQKENGRLPRFATTSVSPAFSTSGPATVASVLQSYLDLPEPTATVQYAAVIKPPGLTPDNMAGRPNWHEVVAYAMYSSGDIHKSKAYLPRGVFTDSEGHDVGPFGRTAGAGHPTSDGWTTGMLDRALAKFTADNAGQAANLGMVPAMYEVNAEYPNLKGCWPWPVPQKTLRGDHVNVLYFDCHAGEVTPDYFHNP